MLLAIDVGNTETAIGVFEQNKLIKTWRIATQTHKTPDEWYLQINGFLSHNQIQLPDIKDIIISSVVPMVSNALGSIDEYKEMNVVFVDPSTNSPINIAIDNPKELGSDRLVNAVAAITIYKSNSIVVDLGTATTFDIVSKDGDYLGGAIAPGILTASESLFAAGAKLHQIPLTSPSSAIGKNTTDSLKSGIIYGFTCLIDGMIEKFINELSWPLSSTKIIATGGLANLIFKESKQINEFNPNLTLIGLNLIHLYNSK